MIKSYIRKISCITLFLMLVTIIIRSKIISHTYYVFITSPKLLPEIILISYYDWLFILSISAFFIALAFFTRNNSKVLKYLLLTFISFTAIIILIGLINVKNVHMLGGPFNYHWLYYSDFLQNSDSKKAITENLSFKLLLEFTFLSLSVTLGGFILNLLVKYLLIKNKNLTPSVYILGSSLTVYFIAGGFYISMGNPSHNKMANPIVAFVTSVFSTGTTPELFTMKLSEDFEKFPTPGEYELTNTVYKSDSKIKNVLLFVLESVPAEYVSGYSGKHKATPNINKHLKHSMVFSDVYAHIPTTNNSLVSLLGSLYPMIAYKTITAEYPEIKWPTISSELKKNNYKTSFFHASDNRFQRMDEFLSFRKFDDIEDYLSISCNKGEVIGSTKNGNIWME